LNFLGDRRACIPVSPRRSRRRLFCFDRVANREVGYPAHGPFPHPVRRALSDRRSLDLKRVVGVVGLVNETQNIFVGQYRQAALDPERLLAEKWRYRLA
jgi:hypothetical protein